MAKKGSRVEVLTFKKLWWALILILWITGCGKAKKINTLDELTRSIVEKDPSVSRVLLTTKEFAPGHYLSLFLENRDYAKIYLLEKNDHGEFALQGEEKPVDLSKASWGATEKPYAYGEWVFFAEDKAYQVLLMRKFDPEYSLDIHADIPLKYYGLSKVNDEFFIAINPVEIPQSIITKKP